jgi:hypothetical protein
VHVDSQREHTRGKIIRQTGFARSRADTIVSLGLASTGLVFNVHGESRRDATVSRFHFVFESLRHLHVWNRTLIDV